jgi:hypothetical protein
VVARLHQAEERIDRGIVGEGLFIPRSAKGMASV